MKRFLVFLLLFPALATAAFFALVYLLTGAVPDSLSGAAFLYLIFVAPALVVAGVDWRVAKTRIPGVMATTLFGYGASTLFMVWDNGLSKESLALGLIGGIPAAVCSWLSREKQNGSAM